MDHYHIYWPVPPTGADAQVVLNASPGLPVSVVCANVVERLVLLAKGCPAGGVMPEPQDGERWALHDESTGKTHTTEMPKPSRLQLVLLDRWGGRIDHAELARVA